MFLFQESPFIKGVSSTVFHRTPAIICAISQEKKVEFLEMRYKERRQNLTGNLVFQVQGSKG